MRITEEQMALIHSLRCERLASNSQEINSIFDKNIKNVGKTFAGVEIVHFCAMMIVVKFGINIILTKVWEQSSFGILSFL